VEKNKLVRSIYANLCNLLCCASPINRSQDTEVVQISLNSPPFVPLQGETFRVNPSLRDRVVIRFFVAADFSLRSRNVGFQRLTPTWAATKSKYDYDTPSKREGD
jgi:hypothetical protein